MLSFPASTVFQASKCFFTFGAMGHLDPQQLPSKKKPWTSIQSLDFIHRIDLILPQECFDIVHKKLVEEKQAPRFHRVVMTLGQILSGDFLKEYVKISDIIMLSEGNPDHDNVFRIRNGQLTMYLDRETYERAGLVGKPHGVKGKRALRPRWIVEYDLHAKSSWPGKKGFDRLIYACKNVLNIPLTWLFFSLSKTPDPDPLATHFPAAFTSSPGITRDINVTQPSLEPPPSFITDEDRPDSEEFATEIYEWLSLLRLQSPRVAANDKIDPYLSCYQPPGDPEQLQAAQLCKITWKGFFPPAVAREILVDAILALPAKSWFCLSMSTFASSKGLAGDGSDMTILRPPNTPGSYLMWEVKAHE